MSSAVLTALLVLPVFSVYGTSLVLNGAVGESIVLPTDEEGPIKGPGLMAWKKNNIDVIRLLSKQGSSSFETLETNAAFKGRLIVNYETGALNISSLREEDSGEYVFEGIGQSGTLGPKTIQLHIYERIVSVQVTSQVNNSTDGSSCHVTLSCSVIGGSQVVLSWSRNGENIAGAESRATLSVSPTRVEENYTCTAINPISSLSNTTRPCQTGLYSPGLSLCALKSVLFSLGLVAMVSAVIAVNVRERCCRDQWGRICQSDGENSYLK
ncbi:SLAM family member 5-like isoform X2 [Anguilla anguilla]|uniref:SLAM family member 5-like isoform X2 n=1 Tax=Anguilla anguilla TaxID=7936 RepID=UPI0015ACB771|nr:SLAM family member 5-like isoform X2 [Anguilla anguilla]